MLAKCNRFLVLLRAALITFFPVSTILSIYLLLQGESCTIVWIWLTISLIGSAVFGGGLIIQGLPFRNRS